jgi:hypothetical protein
MIIIALLLLTIIVPLDFSYFKMREEKIKFNSNKKRK